MVITNVFGFSSSRRSNNEGQEHGGGGQGPGVEDGGEPRARANTRNVTVAIQYSWLHDMRNVGGEGEEAGQGPGENGDTFVMSFTDVPDSTSNDRFQEVIGIAAQFALSRVARRISLLRGLSKESFEKLPLRKLSELDSELCSICYDDFEDDTSIGSKRNRDVDNDALYLKRQRTGGDSSAQSSLSPGEAGAGGDAGGREGGHAGGWPAEEEAEQPHYKHSPTELPCGHVFGRDCIFRWTQEHNSCPICRARIVENEGLNHAVQDTPVVMDEFDRQSFERIRQLIYGDNASSGDRPNGDGGITLQRHNVIVIRPDSASFNGHLQRGEAGTAPLAGSSAGTESEQAPAAQAERVPAGNSPTAPPAHAAESMEAVGVIPLALFSLAPLGAARNTDSPASAQGNDTTPEPATTSEGGSAGTASMNNTDISRLFDLIANLTGRMQPRRNSGNNTNSSNSTLAPSGSSRSGAERSQESAAAPPAPSRFGLFDFLSRGRMMGSPFGAGGSPIRDVLGDGRRRPSLEGRGLFGTGVASFREGTGVRTVDFSGPMPHPRSPPAPAHNTSDEADVNSPHDRTHPDDPTQETE
ncbi:AGL191Wp [Eremothecium gossypii ATCC 10895]|uniref:AGL191Wp n=1 Tax=Eremothecium gossypii (strain ATCC 10895 / CBS 109.51 / FGSC 9923 / NRRL Y-1056) TaxID=284811 RepID=Q750Y0_EREGS|nr:AGL191Wp [Eremothecium gossypii ATCC 10895]AAS54300.2 AGL191Wp [Eremothecium gossypii ATCC 10895]AEY98626.1 FAGL191Wp [Eremothecium gossypii FDAG1]